MASPLRHGDKSPGPCKGSGGFLLDAATGVFRDPVTVPQWIVSFHHPVRDFVYVPGVFGWMAIKGPFDYCADLAAAFWLAQADGLVSSVELLPCTKLTPQEIYWRSSKTVEKFKDDRFWRFWDNFLDAYGGGLPDQFVMMALRGTKKRTEK